METKKKDRSPEFYYWSIMLFPFYALPAEYITGNYKKSENFKLGFERAKKTWVLIIKVLITWVIVLLFARLFGLV